MLEQLHFIGNRSTGIIVLTSAFTGLVLTLQGFNALSRFGAAQMVGALVSLSLVRELAPVLAALMITARAGSAIAATLGNMRVSEQMDALETMAIDPISFTVVPRIRGAARGSAAHRAVHSQRLVRRARLRCGRAAARRGGRRGSDRELRRGRGFDESGGLRVPRARLAKAERAQLHQR